MNSQVRSGSLRKDLEFGLERERDPVVSLYLDLASLLPVFKYNS